MKLSAYQASPGKKVKLKDYPSDDTGPFKSKDDAAEKLETDVARLNEWQAKLYAQDTHALLIVLQGMDTAGKDSIIKHVMGGMNPSGCQVKSFKAPSSEELDHDYLWRHARALPARGQIGIFNRSHYEEVLVVRVHPELLAHEQIPQKLISDDLWQQRFEEINGFERYLANNGIAVLKFFLNLSKAEQKKRFMDRLDNSDKNWKFSEADVRERAHWDEYRAAYEDMLSHTSTEHAPWYIVPADRKWFTRVVVADAIVSKLSKLGIDYPQLDAERKKSLDEARRLLESEEE